MKELQEVFKELLEEQFTTFVNTGHICFIILFLCLCMCVNITKLLRVIIDTMSFNS